MASSRHVLSALDDKMVKEIFEDFISQFSHVISVDEGTGNVRLTGDITFDIPDGKIEFISVGGNVSSP